MTATVCRPCQRPMPSSHLVCAFCLADGKRPNADDIAARDARIDAPKHARIVAHTVEALLCS